MKPLARKPGPLALQRRHALAALLTPWMAAAQAQRPLRVLTEELPPYNFQEAGKLTGFSTDIVRAVLAEAQLEAQFELLPWARAYEMAQQLPDVLIYSIGRTPQRESLFKWVGALTSVEFYLFSHVRRPIQLASLDDARSHRIATVNSDVGEQYLQRHGFSSAKQLQPSVRYELNYEKLKRGRVDLWIMDALAARHVVRRAGDRPDEVLVKSLRLQDLPSEWYLACSLSTSDAVVDRLREALGTVRREGRFEGIRNKWYQ